MKNKIKPVIIVLLTIVVMSVGIANPVVAQIGDNVGDGEMSVTM